MMKTYDGLYIFASSAKDDVLDKHLERARGEITRLGGNVLKMETLGKRAFARAMRKRDSGIYVKIRFELDPAQVATLNARYLLIEEVFRVQILAVDARREALLTHQEQERAARAEARAAATAAAEQQDALNPHGVEARA